MGNVVDNILNSTVSKLRKLQLIELQALKELSTFCTQNGIGFFLRGGSVLGAVKYQGFIPWDDDMDIAVPREDYDKLIKLAPNCNSELFTIESYKFNKDTHCYFPRIVLKEEIRKKLDIKANNALGLVIIDILPLDGSPSSVLGRKIYYLKVLAYRLLAALWTVDVKETVNMNNGKRQKIFKVLCTLQIHKFYTQESIYERLDKLYTKYDWKQSSYAGTITGSLNLKEVVPAEFWGKGKCMNFEDTEFLVPVKSDEYLKLLYGTDYMEYEPSVEERKSHQLA